METMDVTNVHPEIHESGSKFYELIGAKAGNAAHHSIAYVEFLPGGSCDLHYHPEGFEESYYILEGVAKVQVADQFFDLKPGQVMCMPPLVLHNITNVGTDVLKFLSISTPVWDASLHISASMD